MARSASVSLLLLLALAGSASAARSPAARTLLQSGQTTCDKNCAPETGSCQFSDTTGLFRCVKCLNNLLATEDGTCGCAAGQYLDDTTQKCLDCPIGNYCPGGTRTKALMQLSCNYAPTGTTTEGLTTVRTKTKTRSGCVNKPGYYYQQSSSGAPTATPCGPNSYSVGYRRQKACTPCPAGMKTDPAVSALKTDATVCKAPPGWFMDGVFGKVGKCPRGEYRNGYSRSTACTKCPDGTTTKTTGKTLIGHCELTLPGWRFTNSAATGRRLLAADPAAEPCPQKSYCPGGINIANGDGATSCNTVGTGLWTRGLRAKSADECLVPPGYKFSDNALSKCVDGEFQPKWGKKTDITACTKCGNQLMWSDETVSLDVYDPTKDASFEGRPDSETVRGSETSCYIKQGMGIVQKPDLTIEGKYCTGNSYGVSDKTYGRDLVECRQCPFGTVTSDTGFTWPTDGKPADAVDYPIVTYNTVKAFYGPEACLVPAGYSYDGSVAIKCPKGTYAPGKEATKWDDLDGKCQFCPEGLTTSQGINKVVGDCNTVLPGYRALSTSATAPEATPCDIGTFGLDERSLADTPTATCSPCTTSSSPFYQTTTSSTKAVSRKECNQCNPGYGSTQTTTDLNTQDLTCSACGTASTSATGTFGPADRKAGEDFTCKTCPSGDFTQVFSYAGNKDFTPRIVTPTAATSAAQCTLEFAQISSSYNMELPSTWASSSWTTTYTKSDTTTDPGFSRANCVTACTNDAQCQFVQWDHAAAVVGTDVACRIRKAEAPTSGSSSYLIAIQAVLSTQQPTTAKSLSGAYTFWQDMQGINFRDAATQVTPTPANYQACLDACTADTCAIAAMQFGVETAGKRPLTSCWKLVSDIKIGGSKQLLLRAVPNNMQPASVYTP